MEYNVLTQYISINCIDLGNPKTPHKSVQEFKSIIVHHNYFSVTRKNQ